MSDRWAWSASGTEWDEAAAYHSREEAMRRLGAWAEGVPTADLLAVVKDLLRAERERGS